MLHKYRTMLSRYVIFSGSPRIFNFQNKGVWLVYGSSGVLKNPKMQALFSCWTISKIPLAVQRSKPGDGFRNVCFEFCPQIKLSTIARKTARRALDFDIFSNLWTSTSSRHGLKKSWKIFSMFDSFWMFQVEGYVICIHMSISDSNKTMRTVTKSTVLMTNDPSL